MNLKFCPTCDGNTYLGSIGQGDERRCPECDGAGLVSASSVPDPVADTARELADKYRHARAVSDVRSIGTGNISATGLVRGRALLEMETIKDAARACGIQVEAAFNALLTGDAGRAPEVGDA